MGSLLSRPEPRIVSHTDEELGARELGLENNLKLTEVNTLIDYYKQNDPDNDGLLPEQFKEAAGQFMASELTIDPKVVFSIFDTGEGGVAGRVTLREFILGYAILCRGSTEGRLRYLFAIYGDADGTGFLTRAQLIRCLTLMQRIVSETTDQPDDNSDGENEKQVNAVADQLIGDSDPEKDGISYHDFIQKLREDEVVTAWLEHLSTVAGEHLKYMEKRERDVVELHMEREGILRSESSQRVSGALEMEWEPARSEQSGQLESSDSSKRRTIPMPKKQKLVRRDLRRTTRNQSGESATPGQPEDDSYQEINVAKPFVINYEQIEFGKILGRGACATVYECEWMHVPVAVKVFNDGHGDAAGIEKLATNDEENRKAIVGDYVEEFWLLLQIRHPNCLLYMGICFEPVVCIVTELYTGGSVANFLHGPNPRKFTPEKALEMLCGVARGMYYLHASSPPILHRDLKASNILINRSVTHCVICDFGLSSQFVNEASGMASRENVNVSGVGTPYTMAPEVMQRIPYTPAADVYSFGIVMYEMYTGRFPFPRMKPIQLMFSVTEGNRPPFYEADNVPPILRTLIERCWAQKPEERPTFEEILKVLTSRELTKEVASRQSVSQEQGFVDGSEAKIEELSRQLLEAVYRGRDELVARLIDQGAKVNYSDYDKRTALHVGAAEGRSTCIRLLITAGARLSFDRWNNSPLVDAANYEKRTGDSEPVRLLRAIEGRSGGHVGEAAREGFLDAHQREILRNQAAMIAAADGDVNAMKKLLDNGLDVNCSDYDRRTPLTVSLPRIFKCSSTRGSHGLTDPEVEMDIVLVMSITKVAASEGRREIVQLLIEHGADIEHRDRWASTAYHEAERGGYHDIIRLLRQAAVESVEHPLGIRNT